ncbi:hypothetical protein [Actinokineospora cianjurensis]|uniref:Uncharacterized protein n=1 Tax=Actinokineospora cianjurensis TaxID=585224 RepID=A0A421B1Z0_9PSEU|nr:hypothetical protein [Actinokineospora cianjurensis]RLK58358.1 hypothetical protein CLV68_4456 [Actinokineospora cianjurensis]
MLAGITLGGLAAGVATITLTGTPAAAAGSASTAYGVSAAGVEGKTAQPSVSSTGEVKTASGAVSGMGWSATGITVTARAGYAQAVVGGLTVGGRSLGSASATCENGRTSYKGLGAIEDSKLRVLPPGGGAAATVQILGAGDTPVQTITVAVVSCDDSGDPPLSTTSHPTTEPTEPSEPTATPTDEPSGAPDPTGSTRPTRSGTTTAGTSLPDREPVRPAPMPVIQEAHHPVTG